MKKLIAAPLILQLAILPVFAQDPAPPPAPQQQLPPGAVIENTPFGPRIVFPPGAPVAQPQQATPPPQVDPAAAAQPAQPPAAAQAAQQPAAQAAAQDDPIIPIVLTFDNSDIYPIIRIIMDALNLNYIIDPTVRGTVNINTAGQLRRSDLLPILETILKINNATLIQTGNFYQIVPVGSALRQPLQVQEAPPPVNPDDQMVMQIVRMRFVPAGDMTNLLNPYLSEGANITAHNAGSILIITERRSNLRKLLEIVDIFDTNVFQDERVRIFPVQNNLARDLVNDLNTVFAGYGLSQGQAGSAVRFAAIDRINSILVITPNVAVFPEVQRWLDRLDQNAQRAGIRNFVYKVRNAKASDLQTVLAQLYGDPAQLSTIYNLPSTPAAAVQAATPPPPQGPLPAVTPPPAGAQAGQIRPVSIGSGEVKIIADTINNLLVIQANPQVYQEIERTLQELDVLPRQVLIDAQIYEVSLDDSLALGISAFLTQRSPGNSSTTAAFAGSPPQFTANTFAHIGRTRELLLFLNAVENRSRIRTLSAPSVMVSDNMNAQFTVGADVPVPTTSSVTPVQSDGTNLFAQTIAFRSTGVILNVRPQINDSGNVTLEVTQEISQAGANTTSAVAAPVIGRSAVSSTIVVQDGQTIVLSGFIRENNDLSRSRVPLLGRIPVAGALFGNTQRSTTRSELIVLITPHVLRTHADADRATEEMKSRLREVQNLLR